MTRFTFQQIAAVVATVAILWSNKAMGTENQNQIDASGIKAAAERWAEAFGRGDVDSIVGMYTEDAKLLPEGSDAITGPRAIQEFFQKMKTAQPRQTIRFSNFEFFGSDANVTECSDFEIKNPDGSIGMRGKQVLIRVKQNGNWRIHRDIWTTNGPIASEYKSLAE